jgi:formylglycine-generating enzyme required for sulfatase activity
MYRLMLLVPALIWVGCPALPPSNLTLDVSDVTVDINNCSARVTITNTGTQWLRWRAESNNAAVVARPSSNEEFQWLREGESIGVTISATDTSAAISAQVQFINAFEAADVEVVQVSVVQSGVDPVVAPVMVATAGGAFLMGSNSGESGEEVREVTLNPFSIGIFEVTCGEYARVLNWANAQGLIELAQSSSAVVVRTGGQQIARANRFDATDYAITFNECGAFVAAIRDGVSLEDYPVYRINWFGAVAYCNWLSENQGLSPAYDLATWALVPAATDGYRLPFEAEWEFAAAWDGERHWTYGFMSDTLDATRANFDHNNPMGFVTGPDISPVGFYDGTNGTVDSPSPMGAYDMTGNVWEWCYEGGVSQGVLVRITRGGSWGNIAQNARTARRYFIDGETFTESTGFRVARSTLGGGGA